MRRLWGLGLAMLVVSAIATGASAAPFASVKKSTMTARAMVTGGSISVGEPILVNAVNNGIGWQTPVEAGSGWKIASTYIILHSTVTKASSGIQIYTDNKAADAVYRYTGIGNPAGMVAHLDNDPSASSTTIAMCWRVTDSTTSALSIVQGTDNKLYSSEEGGQDSDFPCFFWMKDRNTPAGNGATAFANGDDYVVLKDSARGLHYAEGDLNWSKVSSPDIIYFGADFSGAMAPCEYAATIRIEAFTE